MSHPLSNVVIRRPGSANICLCGSPLLTSFGPVFFCLLCLLGRQAGCCGGFWFCRRCGAVWLWTSSRDSPRMCRCCLVRWCCVCCTANANSGFFCLRSSALRCSLASSCRLRRRLARSLSDSTASVGSSFFSTSATASGSRFRRRDALISGELPLLIVKRTRPRCDFRLRSSSSRS
jgi:hypothetical protein